MDDVLLERLQLLRDRLLCNDPSLTVFEPWKDMEKIPFSFHYLDDETIQQALQECWRACHGNTACHTVRLHALPEPELCQALQHVKALRNLQELTILQNTASQSLPVTSLTDFLQPQSQSQQSHHYSRLRKLDIATRLQITSQEQITALAAALSACRSLDSLTLHLLPRCSIQAPNLHLDALFTACCDTYMPVLTTLVLVAGYQHNPYYKPLVSVATFQRLFQQNNAQNAHAQQSGLQHVLLDNLGLRNDHVQAISTANAAATNATGSLQSLQLPRNPHLTAAGWQGIADSLLCDDTHHSKTNYTLQHCPVDLALQSSGADKRATSAGAAVDLVVQETIALGTFLNRLGRGRLLQDLSSHALWMDAVAHATAVAVIDEDLEAMDVEPKAEQDQVSSSQEQQDQELLSLNASYSLLRLNPSLCQASRRQRRQRRQRPPIAAPPLPLSLLLQSHPANSRACSTRKRHAATSVKWAVSTLPPRATAAAAAVAAVVVPSRLVRTPPRLGRHTNTTATATAAATHSKSPRRVVVVDSPMFWEGLSC